jgi:hypothetical protein
MRVSEKPVCIYLFRQNPVFTSRHLRPLVHVVPPWFVLFHLDLLSRVPGVCLPQMTLVNVAVVATSGAAVAAATTLSVAHPLSQLGRPVAANGMNKCYIYVGGFTVYAFCSLTQLSARSKTGMS